MKYRKRYVPLNEVQVGMLLGAPANAVRRGAMIFSLPADHALTEENIQQLAAHEVEYIYVLVPDLRDDATIAADSAASAQQTVNIFAGADLSDPTMLAFFDQVLQYRSQ